MSDNAVMEERFWCILDSLAEGQQPLEQIYFEYASLLPELIPYDLVADLVVLRTRQLITISQRTVAITQEPARSTPITPSCPDDIIDPVRPQFDEFANRRDYLSYADGVGVPLGIWVELTQTGYAEWDDPQYAPYWKKEEIWLGPRVRVPRSLTWGCVGLLLSVLMATAVIGFTRSTGTHHQEDYTDYLGPCLYPIIETLTAAHAPVDVLRRLEFAARPDTYGSEAFEVLKSVNQALEPMSSNPEIAAVRQKLDMMTMETVGGPVAAECR